MTPGWGHNLTNHGRGPLGDATYNVLNIEALGLVVQISMFSYISLVGVGIFGHRDIV